MKKKSKTQKLIFDKQPIITILQMNKSTFPLEIIFSKKPKLKNYQIPKLSNEQLEKLLSESSNEIRTSELLSMFSFSFILNDEDLKTLTQIIKENPNTELSSYASYIILNGFVSFIGNLFHNKTLNFSIFDALLKLDLKLQNIGLSSFFYGFKILSLFRYEAITPAFFHSLVTFFLFDYEYPPESIEIFYDLVKNFQTLDNFDDIPIVQLVCELFQNENLKFHSSFVDKFITLFENKFLKFNNDYIVSFNSLLKYSTPGKFDSIFEKLPLIIFHELLKNHQKKNDTCNILNENNSGNSNNFEITQIPTPQVDLLTEQNEALELNIQMNKSSLYSFPENEMFSEPFNPTNLTQIPQLSIVSNEVIDLISPLLQSPTVSQQYAKTFLFSLNNLIQSNSEIESVESSSLSDLNHSLFLELIYVYLLTALSMPNEEIIQLDSDSLTEICNFPIIMKRKDLTIFNCDYVNSKFYNDLFYIRKQMIRLFLRSQNHRFFRHFFFNISNFPNFLSEILYYLISLSDDIKVFFIKKVDFDFLYNSTKLYSTINISNISFINVDFNQSQNYFNEIKRTRSYLVFLFSKFILEYGDGIMTKEKFIYLIISQLLEKNLCVFTINIIKNYLMTGNNIEIVMDSLSSFISDFIKHELIDENNIISGRYDECIFILIQLFELIADVIKWRNDFIGIENFFNSASTLVFQRNNQNSLTFFKTYFKALILVKDRFSMKQIALFIHNNCLQLNENTENIYNDIKLLVQETKIDISSAQKQGLLLKSPSKQNFQTSKHPKSLHSPISPKIMINQSQNYTFSSKNSSIIINLINPEILTILYELSIKYPILFRDYIDFLLDLFINNKKNIVIANQSGFDEFLISKLTEKENFEIQSYILKVFEVIASEKSSPSVVLQYISKLKPNNRNFLPLNEEILAESLRKIVLQNYYLFSNTQYQKYNCKNYLKAISIPNENDSFNVPNFQKDFTLSFWIFDHKYDISNSNDEIKILSVHKLFSFYLTGNSLIFVPKGFSKNLFSNESICIGEITPKFSWNFIALVYDSSLHKTIFYLNENRHSVFINNSNKNSSYYHLNHLSISLGSKKLIESNNSNIEISSVSLYKTVKTPQKLMNYFINGPAFFSKKHLINFNELNTEYNQKEFLQKRNFSYYLLNAWQIDIILPLFALSEIPFSKENSYWDDIFFYSTDIFSSLFLSQTNMNANTISSLSCILQSTNPEKLTFSLYSRFFELFRCIGSNYDDIKKAIFTDILSNYEIWIQNNSYEIVKIVKHWAQFLCEPFAKYFSFSFLLNFPRSYFNEQKTEFEECRKNIRLLLLYIAKNKFTKEDFDNLIIECVTENSEFSLMLFNSIIAFASNQLRVLNLQIKDVIKLNRVIMYKNQHLICEMIETIINLHQEKLINDISLYDHLTLILQELTPPVIQEEFFERIIGIMKIGVYELIPMCSWYCLKKNDPIVSLDFVEAFCSLDFITKEFNKLKNDLNTKENQDNEIFREKEIILYIHILFWPLILASRSVISIKLPIIQYIIQKIPFKWKEILILIDIACNSVGDDPKDLQFFMLDNLFQHIHYLKTNKLDYLDINGLRDYYGFLLFYQKNYPFIDQKLQKLYLETYNIDISKFIKPKALYISPLIITKNINHLRKEDVCFVQSIRKWDISIENKDAQNGRNFLQILLNNNNNKDFDSKTFQMSKILFYILSHDYSNLIQEHINKFGFSYSEIFQTPILFKAYNNIDSFFNIIAEEYSILYKKILYKANNAMKIHPMNYENLAINLSFNDEFHYQMYEKRKTNQRVWARLWSSLSISKGPWDSEIVNSYRGTAYWKRDNAHCFAFCPMKMKRNFNFMNNKNKNTISNGKISSASSTSRIALALFETNSAHSLLISEDTINYQNENNLPQENKIDSPRKDNEVKNIRVEQCKVIKVSGSYSSEIIIFKDRLEITVFKKINYIIKFENIIYLLKRNRYHIASAIEIFTKNGLSIFIDFESDEKLQSILENLKRKLKYYKFQIYNNANIKVSDDFIKHFQYKQSFSQYFHKRPFTFLWKTRKISNFEYLMYINIFSGRSFNDISQYPFFPWVLSDYSSTFLNLSNPEVFRPLNKPIGTVSSKNLTRVLSRYKDYDEDELSKPCMFTSGPISPLSICLYLTRMEPFTTMHLQLQGGQFDLPDRLVSSISDLYNSITNGNAESWELSPEFFFQTEFLINDNNFDLGKINNKEIDEISLPAWSTSPFDFIYKHRKALESEYVSNHLNEWIDLNFGYLQKSVEANNVYDDKLYEDVWQNYSNLDPVMTQTILTTLQMVGQIPPKIFREPHPKREEYKHEINQSHLKSIEGCDSLTPEFCMFHVKDDKCSVILLSKKCELSIVDINDDSAKIIKTEYLLQNSLNNNACDFTMKKLGDGRFAIIFEDTFIIFDQNEKKSYKFFEKTKYIASAGHWLISNAGDSFLKIYNNFEFYSSTRQYRDVVTCCTVSNTYKITIIGTKDGGLIIGSLPSGVSVRVIELGRAPKKVMITPGWGFIVAYIEEENPNASNSKGDSIYEIVVHSLNGLLIKRIKLDMPIDSWIGWKSRSGFDFIAIAQGRKISYFEVYFLEKIFVTRTSHNLIGFTYIEDKSTFLFVEENGLIERFQFPIDDLLIQY